MKIIKQGLNTEDVNSITAALVLKCVHLPAVIVLSVFGNDFQKAMFATIEKFRVYTALVGGALQAKADGLIALAHKERPDDMLVLVIDSDHSMRVQTFSDEGIS